MHEYQKSDLNKEKVESIVSDYMQMRLNDCLLSNEFAHAMKTDNANLFVKVLRERIFEELKLTEEAQVNEELDWTKSVDFFNANGAAEVEYR